MPLGTRAGIIAGGIVLALVIVVGVVALVKVSDSGDDKKPQAKGAQPAAKAPPQKPAQPGAPALPPKPAEVHDLTPQEAAASAGAGFLGLGISFAFTAMFCSIPLLYLAAVILMLAWVVKDARARNMDGAIWVLIILISGPVGLIVYVVSRPVGVLVPCPGCGNKRLMVSRLCPHCGAASAAV